MNRCVSYGINKVSSVTNTDTRRSMQFLIVNAAAAAKEVQPRHRTSCISIIHRTNFIYSETDASIHFMKSF